MTHILNHPPTANVQALEGALKGALKRIESLDSKRENYQAALAAFTIAWNPDTAYTDGAKQGRSGVASALVTPGSMAMHRLQETLALVAAESDQMREDEEDTLVSALQDQLELIAQFREVRPSARPPARSSFYE